MGKKPVREAPGWDAIDGALAKLYPGQEPRHWAPDVPASLGGEAPLEGVSVYASDRNTPHWHAVSYGMSELFEKTSKDKRTSGFGFEFTLRLARGKERMAPRWPAGAFQALAGYVLSSGRVFDAGHRMNTGHPLGPGGRSRLTCIAFLEDPELGTRRTPHGRVRFLQIVGLTADELEAMKATSTEKVLRVMARTNPLLVTDLRRTSILGDAGVRKTLGL